MTTQTKTPLVLPSQIIQGVIDGSVTGWLLPAPQDVIERTWKQIHGTYDPNQWCWWITWKPFQEKHNDDI